MADKITSGTEPQNAPVTEPKAVVATPALRKLRIERQGSAGVPMTYKLPDVRGGQCEWCGVMDPAQPAEYQYLLCPHYREIGALRCSYCEERADPTDVLLHSKMLVYVHPDDPDKLVVLCGQYECTRKHEKRFSPSAR